MKLLGPLMISACERRRAIRRAIRKAIHKAPYEALCLSGFSAFWLSHFLALSFSIPIAKQSTGQ
jgi:hypothetical protein